MEELIKVLQVMLRTQEEDDKKVFEILINQALGWIALECNRDLDLEELGYWEKGVKELLIDMVIFRYTVLGKEGVSSENIVELSYTYGQDYPPYIVRRMKKFRLPKVHTM
jgi:hypothetical protein